VGDRSSFYGVLNSAGEVILEERVATNPEAVKKVFQKMPSSRIALETGTHSPWVSRLLTELGNETIVAHSRNVRLIWAVIQSELADTSRLHVTNLSREGIG
jgi:transposase